MDADTFDRWLNDVSVEYKDTNTLDPLQGSVVDGFVGWASTKYHMELDLQARDKFAEPCCGGVCKEESNESHL